MPDEAAHRYLFVAIDRASRWVYVAMLGEKTAAHAAGFLQRRVDQAPFKVQKVLTDNGKEFTDRCCATGERDPTGRHRFDRTCDQHGIAHRLIKSPHPQTNGMVERFNGRISEVLATTRFDAAQCRGQVFSGLFRLVWVGCQTPWSHAAGVAHALRLKGEVGRWVSLPATR